MVKVYSLPPFAGLSHMAELSRASHGLSAGRPCERRDPSPLAPRVKKRPLLQVLKRESAPYGSLRSQGRPAETSRKTGNNACRASAVNSRHLTPRTARVTTSL